MPPSALVRQLVAARRARGMTQAGLATALGLGRTTVSNWEVGYAAPSMDDFLRWASLLGLVVLLVPAETLQQS